MKRLVAFLLCAIFVAACCSRSATHAKEPTCDTCSGPVAPPPSSSPPPAPPSSTHGGMSVTVPTPPPPPAQPPKEAAPPALSLEAPKGWAVLSGHLGPGIVATYVNPNLRAQIVVSIKMTDENANVEVMASGKAAEKSLGLFLGTVRTSDNFEALAMLAGKDRQGMVGVRLLGHDKMISVTFLGTWPTENVVPAMDAFEGVVKSAKIQ